MQAAAIAISAAMFTRSCNSCVGLAVGRAACCSSHTARVVGVQLQLQSSGSAARRRSLEEAARYVETFRAYEKRQADIIQHKVSCVCVCAYVQLTVSYGVVTESCAEPTVRLMLPVVSHAAG